MSSTLWLVPWRRSGLEMLADPRTVVHGAGDVVNPNSSSPVSALGVGLLRAPYFFIFGCSFPFSLSSSPRSWFPVPCSSPREEVSNSELIARSSFIGPNLLSLYNYISRDQYVTSGVGFLVPSYIHFILHIFHTYHRVSHLSSFVLSSLYTNTIFSTLLIGFFVPLSLVPLSLVLSSLCPSSLHPSSRHPFVPSSHAIINKSDFSQYLGECLVHFTPAVLTLSPFSYLMQSSKTV